MPLYMMKGEKVCEMNSDITELNKFTLQPYHQVRHILLPCGREIIPTVTYGSNYACTAVVCLIRSTYAVIIEGTLLLMSKPSPFKGWGFINC